MKKIYSLILGMMLTLTGMIALAAPVIAVVCPEDSKQALKDVDDLSLCNAEDPTGAEGNLMNEVMVIINFALGVIGFVAVAFIIIGGVQYMTSQGDPGKITRAKNTIMYSVIGLIISLLAFAIVNFVLTSIF